jgi:hypothetical protein
MKKLAWAGLPPQITQEQFSAFVTEHPAMKILELIKCEEITDLSPLKRLKGLTGLIISRTAEIPDSVGDLKTLTFLGLTADAFDNNQEKIARIRAALPRALVVPASPLCLGSGWILPVIPLAALMWFMGAGARRRRRAST